MFTDAQLDRAGRAYVRAMMDGHNPIEAIRRELLGGPKFHLDNFEVEDEVFKVPDQLDNAQNKVRDLARRYRTCLQEKEPQPS